VGDTVVATYMQALAADVREPTQEELEEPWVELDATAIAEAGMDPGVVGLRVVRAVCTIEGMNRVTRTVMIEDPRGKYHVIADVDTSRLEGLTLGTKVIMVYSQAVALTLEKQ
jgi:saccharopine dehydrogenase-like NADP-dependent oxidoreductase